ncbi:MAG: hypothetical protein EOO02_00135 [Chitinophagaceae bacterium]|nr:MAG: hypothetical protein EOO02_00135 [Chitinophagaceae bacterium]
MDTLHLQDDINVMGIHVKNFPLGVKEAFDELYEKYAEDRRMYGLSWMDENNQVTYYAMTEQKDAKEATKLGYESLVITKGSYHTTTVDDWMSKTGTIKDVFGELLDNRKPDRENPCIEWYKSDDQMICMVKI